MERHRSSRRRWVPLVSLAVSSAWGLSGGALRAQEPPVFEDPASAGELEVAGGVILRGSLTRDGLALYYTVWNSSQNTVRIWRATRPDRDTAFTGGAELGAPANVSWAWSQYAWVSPDERWLYFTTGNSRSAAFGGWDIWVALKTAEDSPDFDQVLELGDPVNTSANEMTGCVSADGRELFFVSNGALSVARFVEPHDPRAGFTEVRNLAELNRGGWWAMAASLSPDGLHLFWSDTPPSWWQLPPRPGGCGGADLWMATRPGTSPEDLFSEPLNLGCPPNGPGDAICPVVSPDGRMLYFSSLTARLQQAEIACLDRAGTTASFTVSPGSGVPGDELAFDGSSSSSPAGAITSYEWALGDGARAEGERVSHRYSAPGRYEVQLTARTAAGACDRTSELVTVRCPGAGLGEWTATDVGGEAFPGSSRFEGDGEDRCLAACAGGRGLYGSSDGFHYVHREVSGDITLTARVAEVDSAGQTARAGVMLRESLDAGSRYASAVVEVGATGSSRFRLRWREETDGSTRLKTGELAALPLAWVQIRREGREMVALVSPDGVEWTEIRPDAGRVAMDLPEVLFAGVAVAGAERSPDQPYRPVTAAVCDIALETRPWVFVRGDSDSTGEVNLADGLVTLNGLFRGQAIACADAADADDSGRLDITDGVRVFLWLFRGGESFPPPAPGTTAYAPADCGPDPTADGLDCGLRAETCR